MGGYNDWFGDTFSEIVVKYQIREGFEKSDVVAQFIKEELDCPEEDCILDISEVERVVKDLAKKVEDEKTLFWYLQFYLNHHAVDNVDIYDYEENKLISINRLEIEKESEQIENQLKNETVSQKEIKTTATN